MNKAYQESTPLTQDDCLVVFERRDKEFNFPIHFHIEYELNFIKNAANAKRIVGNHSSIITNKELILLGPNIPHVWDKHNCSNQNIHEYTVQFHRDLFSENLLRKNAFRNIYNLLEKTKFGISFSQNAIETIESDLEELSTQKGIYALTSLISILEKLSQDTQYTLLLEKPFELSQKQSGRLQKAFNFIEQHFQHKLALDEIATHVNMTSISFSRLFKKNTGKTFVEYLNDYRVQYSMRLLHESEDTISEIAFQSGFSNQANFNRIFKSKTGLTPREFRANFEADSVVK